MSRDQTLNVPVDELGAFIERLAGVVEPRDFQIAQALVETVRRLSQLLDENKISMARLRRLLFGATTEKRRNVLPHSSEEPKTADERPWTDRPKPKGHGRNGADSYPGAERIRVPHPSLNHEDPCPVCGPQGKVYLLNPGRVLRVVGQPPLKATVYEPDKLRCHLCGELFTAPLPDDAAQDKYDETAGSMVALMKYGSGMPFYRLQNMQNSVGVPLPAATQWELVARTAERCAPAYEELIEQAAQGQVVHNDDTVGRILDLPPADESGRTGIFTTAIVSTTDRHSIALFATGRKHAGENLADVLRRRPPDKGPPIQMCDALSRNLPGQFETLLANCLTHGRRQFVEVAANFPAPCRHVIDVLAEVYRTDAKAKELELTPDARLALHQAESKPRMDQLNEWIEAELEGRRVEPNSSLGKAMAYMLRHWQPLTLFLRQPGAPLDNGIAERALKMAVLHRKNSLFYKTTRGAAVGDLFMTLIHTCRLHRANPFRYLTALQKHRDLVCSDPRRWMPWNFDSTLQALDTS